MGSPLTRASNAGGGRQKSRFWAYIWLTCLLLTLQSAVVVNTVAGVSRPPSRKLRHVAGVDCGRRRRNVYDKKPQRYAKDNRTAHLTARSDKSVAYLTNNKRLYSTFCTVEANHWQTRSIARPLRDSRSTCNVPIEEFIVIPETLALYRESFMMTAVRLANHFRRAMLCIARDCAVARCPSVCLSVCYTPVLCRNG